MTDRQKDADAELYKQAKMLAIELRLASHDLHEDVVRRFMDALMMCDAARKVRRQAPDGEILI